MSVILEVNILVLNKCFAFHVTSSSLLISPEIVPAIASSPVFDVEILCRFMLLLKSNTLFIGASMNVVI